MEGKGPIYTLNGFFVSMRSMFTKPGTEIYYFSMEWGSMKLSRPDFAARTSATTTGSTTRSRRPTSRKS